MSEAGVHFELYRYLENAIDDEPNRGNRTYQAVAPEFGDGIQGYADLVLFDSTDEPVLVIEEGVIELFSHRDDCASRIVSAFVVGDCDDEAQTQREEHLRSCMDAASGVRSPEAAALD